MKDAAALRIVVVEDNPDAREMLELFLSLEGHDVAGAGDGAAGLDMIVQRRPDVALVDVGLPRLDGFEVGRQVRQQLGDAVKLVALTGYGDVSDKERTKAAGFDAHMVKPVEPEALSAFLRSLGERTAAAA